MGACGQTINECLNCKRVRCNGGGKPAVKHHYERGARKDGKIHAWDFDSYREYKTAKEREYRRNETPEHRAERLERARTRDKKRRDERKAVSA
jgi:hypothetical protein